jgi:hypothetical protein
MGAVLVGVAALRATSREDAAPMKRREADTTDLTDDFAPSVAARFGRLRTRHVGCK